MSKKTDLIAFLEQGFDKLNTDFPKNREVTAALFQKVSDFLDTDFEEMTDNCVYRHFLTSWKEIISFAVQAGVSKSYLRCFLKHLNNKMFLDYLGSYAKTRANDFRLIMNRFVNCFTVSNVEMDSVLREIVYLIDCWM